jgi:hypothetical protein
MTDHFDISATIAILTDPRFNPRYCRTFAACMQYHGKTATIADLCAFAKLPERTLSYQLSCLKFLGIVTTRTGKNCLSVVLVHHPAEWASNSTVRVKTIYRRIQKRVAT